MNFCIPLTQIIAVLLLFSNIYAQEKDSPSSEKWSIDPRLTGIYPTGEYTNLPQVKFNEVPLRTSPVVLQRQDGLYMLNPNFRPHPTTTTTQSEVIVVRHATNQGIMFGSSNAIWPPGSFSGMSEGVYVSTNSGANWVGWDTLNSPGFTGHGGDPGPVIDKNGVFIMTHLGYLTSGISANYSTNNGLTWSSNYTIASGTQDKNFAGTDDDPSSPYFGRTYCVWSLWLTIPAIAISRTTNSGINWTAPLVINTPASGHYSQGADIRIGPGGVVYVCWAAPISNAPFTEDFAGFAKSTNGGVNWTVTENAYDMNGIRGNFSNKNNIRVNGFPRIDVDRSGGPRNGWIYIVTAEKSLAPAGSDPDVILHRSTNGGLNWSAGIRVNQDPVNNGKYQWFPAIRVDEQGGINIVYYDDRTVTTSQAEVYMSRSIDGGTTWTDTEISDHLHTPAPITGLGVGYQGDYIGITSGNNKVWMIWADNSTGIYQAWMTSFDIGPTITHTPLPNTENLAGPYTVNCTINPAGSPINPAFTKVFWSRNNPNITDSIQMTNSSGENWTANIPGNGNTSTYRYYIRTADNAGRVVTAPTGAPGTLYTFTASSDISKPVIVHTPILQVPRLLWPVQVTAAITDNIGIDSGWVSWYKNSTTEGIKQFKLINTSASIFQANFNSDTSQVQIGDSIYYRIIAQDNSSNHNKDSTALYSFKITNVVTKCIGTGITEVGYPFYSFFMDSRTDMLYTAAEIGTGTTTILRIGFDVVFASPNVLNGFTIKMQNTNLTTVPSFISTGWTEVYSGNYTVPGTGIQYINLQTPFNYTGENLLIEICFNNNNFSNNSTVRSTAASNRVFHEHADLASGDGCTNITTGLVQASLPNLCLEVNYPIGRQKISTELPREFKLAQNYPNPFNPKTIINYQLAASSNVKLVIFDITGREIAVLVNQKQNAGSYNVEWEASGFASGVYFYKIETDNFTAVKKMVLIK
ncbi:MAG: T9SS C-terminal target domain-containing protein [Ignavibacteriae bacterium]|nr:MAG: T9SS C-terminal target domain-containing protein [Ignavibacteriota bacterium]